MVSGIRLAGLAILAAVSVAAQKGGGSTGGTTGGGGTGGTTGGGTPSSTTKMPTTTTPNTNPPSPQAQQPIFVSGQVIIDGGGPAPRVAIERVCTGHTYREGYTDSKGYFNFQLGQNVGVFADASLDSPLMPGNPGMNQQSGGGGGISQNSTGFGNELWACELRANLGGYHSETVSLMNRRSLDNPDVGVIVLTPMVKVDGYTTSATIALAPKDAKKAYEKGLNFQKHSKPDEAQAEFLHAVEVYPKHAGAWLELGKVYEQRDHKDEARNAYRKAIAADANFVNPYERLYLLALRDSQWKDAAELSDKVLHLNPYDFSSAYYYNALANVQLQNWDAAEKSARESAKIRGTQAIPKSLFLLGLAQANKGDLPGSIETLHSYLRTDPVTLDKERAQKLLGQIEQNMAAQNQGAKTPPQ